VLDNLQAFWAPFGLLNLNSRAQRGQEPWKVFQGQQSFNPTCILSLIPETQPFNPLSLETMFLGLSKMLLEKSAPSEMVEKKTVLMAMIKYVHLFQGQFDHTDQRSFFFFFHLIAC
jgi:hypothetical protein